VAQLRAALQSAVDGVLKGAIAFTPTMVVNTFKGVAEPEGDAAAGSASPRI
jgi:hypothetical protein